ncbi:MAG: nitroreductase family protein [Gorillibacterium sp.]|nr:nitroreductase family protein [Gorillibacterium sp.]
MDVREAIEQRYSVRGYKPDLVEDEKLQQILEAAQLAPTCVNLQAFRILVIPTAGRQEQLKQIYKPEWFVEAPLLLGICIVKEKGWVRRDGRYYGDVDAAIVMDHIILTATSLGLGTCWVAAFKLDVAKAVLELDDTLDLIAFTPIGYARTLPPERTRKPLTELVIYK